MFYAIVVATIVFVITAWIAVRLFDVICLLVLGIYRWVCLTLGFRAKAPQKAVKRMITAADLVEVAAIGRVLADLRMDDERVNTAARSIYKGCHEVCGS